MAGRYDAKVKAILGEDIWQMLKRSVGKGEVDAPRMQDIAYKLHEEVGGGHSRRIHSMYFTCEKCFMAI